MAIGSDSRHANLGAPSLFSLCLKSQPNPLWISLSTGLQARPLALDHKLRKRQSLLHREPYALNPEAEASSSQKALAGGG